MQPTWSLYRYIWWVGFCNDCTKSTRHLGLRCWLSLMNQNVDVCFLLMAPTIWIIPMLTSSEPVRIELIVCYIWIQYRYMGIVWSLCLSLTSIIFSGVGGTVSCRWVRPWHFWCRTCCVSVVLSFVSWSIRCKVISLELCHLQSEVSWTSDHFLGGNIYGFHCKSLYYTQYLFFWLAFPLLAWISRLTFSNSSSIFCGCR